MGTINYPVGNADVQALTATGTQAITISNALTIIDGVTTQATGNRTIDLTIEEGVKTGAKILVQSKTASTQTTVFGTSITGPTITGVAGKTKTALFIYDGSAFVQAGAEVQID